MKRKLFGSTTSLRERVFIRDTSVTTRRAGLTGLTNASSGLTLYYIRDGDASMTAVTLSAGTLGTWASGGFKEVDATHAPGFYEIGIPNAAIASGVRSVELMLRGASNMDDLPIQYELDAVNYQSGAAFVTGVNGVSPPTNWASFSIDSGGRVVLQPSQSFNNTGQTTKYAVTLAFGDVSGNLPANAVQWGGASVTGMPLPTGSYVAPANPADYARNNVSPSWYTAPDNADIAAILTALGGLSAGGLTTDQAAQLADIQTKVAKLLQDESFNPVG